ncbi:hypothetical protein EMN47_12100 [Prolixibacteraceae bacterium JC049]|nr:hypothetical protein [Prolixibacteraceae bacterium JC049]
MNNIAKKSSMLFFLVGLTLITLSGQLSAQNYSYLITASERHKVLFLDSSEQITREINANNTYDGWKLKSGNVLFTHRTGIDIVSPKNETVFQYKSEHEVYACQPLANGNIMVGECSAGRIIEIDRKGKIQKIVPLTYKVGGHTCFRGARKLKNGHYLVSHYGDKTVREYNSKGKVVAEFIRPHAVYAAQRLDNGETIVSDRFCISIYSKKGKLIWEFNTKDHPELGVYHLTGFQLLPNNEIVVCNWLGHKPYHKGIPLFRINRKKEITWTYKNAEATYSCTNIQLLKQ